MNQERRKDPPPDPQQVVFSPAESLGAHVFIVQVAEDVGDDAALLLGPLNHGGVFFFYFRLEKKG